jgi:hypothetical protein
MLAKAFPGFGVTENAKSYSDIGAYLRKYKAELLKVSRQVTTVLLTANPS